MNKYLNQVTSEKQQCMVEVIAKQSFFCNVFLPLIKIFCIVSLPQIKNYVCNFLGNFSIKSLEPII